MGYHYLKKGGSGSTASTAPLTNVSTIVKGVIDDIRENGDSAVRKYSEKFDQWSPESFKLSQEQIDAAIAACPKQTIDDIKQAQANVRAFAQAQKDSLRDFEVETQPVGGKKLPEDYGQGLFAYWLFSQGVFLGQKNIPIQCAGA